MKGIFVFLIFTLFFSVISCNNDKGIIKGSDSCNKYYSYLNKVWLKENDVYFFKGNPNYWELDNYRNFVKEECFIGLSKEQINQLLGKPTKLLKTPEIDLWVYCMDKNCYNQKKVYGGKSLQITFKKDIVNSIITSPTPNNLEIK